MDEITVLGRFPPPLDGQSIATARLASLLEPAVPVGRVELNPGGESHVQSSVRFRPGALAYFVRRRQRLVRELNARSGPIVWTTISPTLLGHGRDVFTVAPAFPASREVFAVVHNGGFARLFERPSTNWSASRLVRRLRGVVFLSHRLAESCERWIPAEKRLVVPNTIDAPLIPTAQELAAKRSSRTDRPFRLLFFSHMIASKGYADVLEAVRLLVTSGADVEADFVGRWDSAKAEQAFSARVAAAGIGHRVRHHGGVQDRTEAKALYLGADLFLLPTYYPTEAQPLTVIEALAAGTPVVVTRHASLPEMVRAGREARFVAAESPQDITRAISDLMDPGAWQRASYDARDRFDAAFSPSFVRRQWLELLAPAGEADQMP